VSAALGQAGQHGPSLRLGAAGVAIAFATLVAGCNGPQPGPRTYYDFKEDSVARDGVLSRCSQEGDTAASDQECIAAKRAAAAAALEQERSRSGGLEQQSERKIVAMRDRAARQQQAEAEAATSARADAKAAYDRQWRDAKGSHDATQVAAPSAPAFGSPIGGVLPSISDSSSLDTVQLPGRPAFGVGDIAPPSSQVEIVQPELELKDVAVVPTRLSTDSN